MDARLLRAALAVVLFASLGAGYKTPNFVVTASSEALAERVGRAAEKYRRELALEWVGKEMPDWSDPCPITVQCAALGRGWRNEFCVRSRRGVRLADARAGHRAADS